MASKTVANRKPKSSKPARTSQKAITASAKPSGVSPVAPGYQWVNPHLIVRNMNAAIDFYQKAFGFELKFTLPGPDGRLVHAELIHNGCSVMLGPENQEIGVFAPQGSSPVTLYTYVENVDEIATRASSSGGRLAKAPADEFWGDRCCLVIDPEGHSWMFATHIRDVPLDEMHP